MSNEKDHKKYTESFFEKLLDWVFKNWKILSTILIALMIGCQAFSGMYDLRSITTNDVQMNWKSWVGRNIVLSNVSIKSYEIHESGEKTFIEL